MCVIIIKPIGKDIDEDILERCWQGNPHGSGFMYADGGKLTVVKGMMILDDFLIEYNKHNGISKNLIIHFRFATSGKINAKQTHPFWIFDEKLAFAHYGHIGNIIDIQSESDTIVFNKNILSKLPVDFLKSEPIVELIGAYIGSSLLVFMDNNGEITMLGDTSRTTYIEDTWYSNADWMGSVSQEEYNDGEDYVSDPVSDPELKEISLTFFNDMLYWWQQKKKVFLHHE